MKGLKEDRIWVEYTYLHYSSTTIRETDTNIVIGISSSISSCRIVTF